jgi:bifunctional DNA-binding transcriptional regulator/antitoxin component of YhaV-PrlF toxin-antitoxin module
LFQPEHRFLYDRRGFQAERARILEFLDRLPGKQLVIVRYGPNHDVHQEWVYNRADIDDSAIVWARSMGREKDLVLLSYFKDRRVWLLDENGQALISSYRAPITN